MFDHKPDHSFSLKWGSIHISAQGLGIIAEIIGMVLLFGEPILKLLFH